MTNVERNKLAIVTTAYTGILCCKNFSDLHEYAEAKLDRPVMGHEFGSLAFLDELKEKCRAEFLELWGLA